MRLRFPNGLFDLHAVTPVLTAGLAFPTERTGYIRVRAGVVGEAMLPVATLIEGTSAAELPLAPGACYRIRANRLTAELTEDGTIHVETLVELSATAIVVHLPRIEELNTLALSESLWITFRVELLDGQAAPKQIEVFASNTASIDTSSPAATLAWIGPGDYEVQLSATSAITVAARTIHASGPGELSILSLTAADASPLPPTLLPEATS